MCTAARTALIRNAKDLNLFSDNPFWSSSLNSSEQILSTRLFLLCIFVSLLIVTAYASVIVRTHSITLNKFSLSQIESLQARYPTTINIPCTQVSIPYHKFIEFSPIFHEICSSSFIEEPWISSLFLPNATSHNILDFRTFSFAQFQALALLCQTAKQAVFDAQRTFHSTNLVTNYLFSREEFLEISSVLIDNLWNNTIANENRTARIVSMSIVQNRIMSALRTNFYIQSIYLSNVYIIYNGRYWKKDQLYESACECRLEGYRCISPAGAFYNWTQFDLDMSNASQLSPAPLYRIPGLMAGCLPLESMRQSTLECLYEQSCIDIMTLQSHVAHPRALNKSSTKFSLNTTIGFMFDRSLFIESWQTKLDFESYYHTCAPRSLTYSYESRLRLASIITICVSAFGGLVIAWQFIIPAFVKIWTFLKRKKQHTNTSDQTDTNSISKGENMTVHIHRTIYTFNLFPSDNESDMDEQYVGIVTTRLYILFLFLGLLVLSFYTSFAERTHTYTVSYPSQTEFEQLESLYASVLGCSCTRFSMSYNRTISISPRYHQICSSQFLDDTWLSYFDIKEIKVNTTFFPVIDFRHTGDSIFGLLHVLCEASQEIVNNALHLFRSRRLVTVHTYSRKQFEKEMRTRFKQFEQQTVTSFVNLLELIRSSTQTNRLVTELLTTTGFSNWFNKQTGRWEPRFYSRNIGNCSCAFYSDCVRPQGFYSQSDIVASEPKIIVPGLVFGCYIIDSLFLSTLECFFEQTCLQLLIDMRQFDAIGLFHPVDERVQTIKPLNHEKTRFLPNATVQSIVSQLFIEDWNNSTNFTAYYTRCAPKRCTYTKIQRFDKAYTITMMLGFYSGLSAILEIILPALVRLIMKHKKKEDDASQSTNKTSILNQVYEVCQSMCSLNLFSTKTSSNGHQEVIATRIYIVLFSLSLFVAFLYAGPFSDEIKTILIRLPTADIVNNLYRKNISTLSCPCSTAAVRHSEFLSIIPQYHSMCSSIYVTPSYWIDLTQRADKMSTTLSAHYRILASLCQLANQTIRSAQDVFNNQELITIEPMTYASFHAQTDALLSTFVAQIPANYRRTLNFIIRSFAVNQLFNVFTSNWKLNYSYEAEQHIIKTYPRRFSSSNCSCATSFDCIESVADGIVSGCFPYDGFRLSKFENLSFAEINDRLFVTTWQNESNYTAYFDRCRPLECQYMLPDRNNPSHMFMTILALYGGKRKGAVCSNAQKMIFADI
ncbi:unnamed protein product [Adineta ricciae]|uniref:Uncharacterized protein n=1 Tax=Adineta ricciae TaxID=249248 RepID=A0A815Y2C5_ADIRI|nr:unnamed protein product [Adineta ricciae]